MRYKYDDPFGQIVCYVLKFFPNPPLLLLGTLHLLSVHILNLNLLVPGVH